MNTTPSREERSLAGSIAAHQSWANTEDRSARTAPARNALEAKFLTQAGGDPVRAEHLRKAHYQRLALRSLRVRRMAAEIRAEELAVNAQLAQLAEQDD